MVVVIVVCWCWCWWWWCWLWWCFYCSRYCCFPLIIVHWFCSEFWFLYFTCWRHSHHHCRYFGFRLTTFNSCTSPNNNYILTRRVRLCSSASCINKRYKIHYQIKTTFTLENIFPDSWRIRDVLVACAEIWNPEIKVRVLCIRILLIPECFVV